MKTALLLAGVAFLAAPLHAAGIGFKDTPMLPPDNKWHVHDGDRPQPKVVTPGTFSTQEAPGKPPSDAVVLFDGKDLSKWKAGDGQPSGWLVKDGCLEVPPGKTKGGGPILTRDEFGDCQLHVEWSAPTPPKGSDQGRGNSGVFMMNRYELQVLDCYENTTYADGTTGALYGQWPPLANVCARPGEWNVYDIVFIAPRFKDGKPVSPACVTLFHNGVLLHNRKEMMGASVWRAVAKYQPHPEKGPIALQDHGSPVRFRNIWIRELKDYDQP